ncbi:hypothetical protein FJ970_02785 [Mesorhizobium sp. B2-1-8]|uniref:hypothetical protein n=1 Tax=Mesorhizobium sp. B2-1-8 TaxID=2589967 RepID=UPI00112B7F16|nr:hypothetical protein [Mesorhizobium sp. B2-1-8]UCI19915.1 hypothetical protein FJ970_02785 [Mesorhizobium sp. B2-1-8]
MDWKAIGEKVVVGAISAVVLAALALLWNFGSGGGLIRALGGATAGQLAELQADAGAIPTGAVVAFDRTDLDEDNCPEGWKPFLYARGRTLVGAGDPQKAPEEMAFDERGRKLEGYILRRHGGEQIHQLTLDELPIYSPVVVRQNGVSFGFKAGTAVPCLDGDKGCNHMSVVTEDRPSLTTTPLSIVGFGKADNHNNAMPPFVAVYYCRKN